MPISPTAEGFRAAFRRPSLTFAEIAWRWIFGGTATALFFFALFEYLGTLPVSNADMVLLRTRHPISDDFWATARDVSFKLIAALAKDQEAASIMKLWMRQKEKA